MANEEIEKLIEVRPTVFGDEAFIFSTWLRGLHYGNPWFHEIDKDIFMENYHRVIESILARPAVEVRVACLKEDPDTIVGYAVLEPDRSALHWVHVKEAWRKFGVMKKLIPDRVVCVTHLTTLGKTLKPKEIKFNPFLV